MAVGVLVLPQVHNALIVPTNEPKSRTMHIAADAHRSADHAGSRQHSPAVGAVMVVLVALMGAVQYANPGVPDVSLLLAMGERVLDGERLYVDILETNPPASVLLYLPVVFIARSIGVKAEIVLFTVLAAGLLFSVGFAGRLLARKGLLGNPASAAAAALAAFGVMAGNSFGQREHIAVIALLPLLAFIICRARGLRVTAAEAMIAGAAGGLAVSIKPHFAAAILLPQLYLLLRTRTLRSVFRIENWVILAIFSAYVISTFVFFPNYWSDVFPVVTEVYRPARIAAWRLALGLFPFVAIVLLYAYLYKERIARDLTAVPLLAAAGFLLACIEQGKGWQYHYYPAVSLCLFVLLHDAIDTFLEKQSAAGNGGLDKTTVGIATAFALLATIHFVPRGQASQSLEAAVRRVSDHPKILSIGGDLSITHPLTRRIGGIWRATVVSQWISETAYQVLNGQSGLDPERRIRLESWIEADKTILIRDIRREDPDVLLIDLRDHLVDWKHWIGAHPELRMLLSGYEPAAKNKYVELYIRRDLGAAAGLRKAAED